MSVTCVCRSIASTPSAESAEIVNACLSQQAYRYGCLCLTFRVMLLYDMCVCRSCCHNKKTKRKSGHNPMLAMLCQNQENLPRSQRRISKDKNHVCCDVMRCNDGTGYLVSCARACCAHPFKQPIEQPINLQKTTTSHPSGRPTQRPEHPSQA